MGQSTRDRFFITGIDTDIGKTVAAAVLTEALQADYWKPIQAGSLDDTDTDFVRERVTNSNSQFHEEAYRLNHFMSPHAAAEKDDLTIEPGSIQVPETDNTLLIEGAGGIMVPLTRQYLVLHLMKAWQYPVILVSRNYLGSINHTLLSIEILQHHNIPIAGVLFNGESTPSTESVIREYSGIPYLGRLREMENTTPETIRQQAQEFKNIDQKLQTR